MEYLNNKDVLPRFIPDSEVLLDDGFSPDWVKHLIITELRLATATPEGTIKSAYPLLDHFQEMGVNGLWLTPVYDIGQTGNGYGSLGPHTIDPKLTGTDDYEQGWHVLKDFVCEAHKKDIRIFLDVVTWGTVNEAPLLKEHPDFYSGEEIWGGRRFQFVDTPWQKWYFDQMMHLIMDVGVDGFRCDCEPHYTGYALFHAVREHCLELGRKIVIFSEDQNERLNTYDFEQFGVMQTLYEWGVDKHVANPRNHYLEVYNIVDSVKTGDGIGSRFSQIHGKGGTYRYYSYNTCCHDNGKTVVDDNLLSIGYQAIFAPFIPIMWIGDEMANISHHGSNCLYFQPPDWSLLKKDKNRKFYETVKQMIRIRRTYADVFTYFPPNHRESNICKVKSNSDLQAYARYGSHKGILILPNSDDASKEINAEIPYKAMGLRKKKNFKYKELMSGQLLSEGYLNSISINIAPKSLVAVLVE